MGEEGRDQAVTPRSGPTHSPMHHVSSSVTTVKPHRGLKGAETPQSTPRTDTCELHLWGLQRT